MPMTTAAPPRLSGTVWQRAWSARRTTHRPRRPDTYGRFNSLTDAMTKGDGPSLLWQALAWGVGCGRLRLSPEQPVRSSRFLNRYSDSGPPTRRTAGLGSVDGLRSSRPRTLTTDGPSFTLFTDAIRTATDPNVRVSVWRRARRGGRPRRLSANGRPQPSFFQPMPHDYDPPCSMVCGEVCCPALSDDCRPISRQCFSPSHDQNTTGRLGRLGENRSPR